MFAEWYVRKAVRVRQFFRLGKGTHSHNGLDPFVFQPSDNRSKEVYVRRIIEIDPDRH